MKRRERDMKKCGEIHREKRRDYRVKQGSRVTRRECFLKTYSVKSHNITTLKTHTHTVHRTQHKQHGEERAECR